MRSISMNALTIGLCGLLILSLSQTANALKEEEREQVRRQISTVKTWQMIEELDLTEEQVQNLVPAQKSFEERKSQLTEQRLKVEAELTELLESKEKNRDLIKEKMGQLKKIDVQSRDNEDQFHEKLSKLLSVEQQAKYELFEKRFDQRLRQMIRDIQKEDLEQRERSESQRTPSSEQRGENGQSERTATEKAQKDTGQRARSDRSDQTIQQREVRREDNDRGVSKSDRSQDSSASRQSDRENESQKKTTRQQTPQNSSSQKRNDSQERSSRQQDEKQRSSRSDSR
jgi:hypothetical protein